ncbi:MAG TPA: holo-ACP synthase [Bacteroidota bacterium]|nr:holo-ACP synthase [Bacteroidota bacterium]
MVEGIGIDVVEIPRLEQTIGMYGSVFLSKVFTEREIAYARSKKNSAHHIAGRFAVKEAVAKAMKTGWAGGFRWKDVEVENAPSGEPSVVLHGNAKKRLSGTTIHVSISHAERVVVACAVIERS